MWFAKVLQLPQKHFTLSYTSTATQKFRLGRHTTVDQLNFAARKFRRFVIIVNLGIFRAIKFRVLVSDDHFLWNTVLHKNACSFLNNGPIFKILLFPETRNRAPQNYLLYLISRICKDREIREIKSHATFCWFTVYHPGKHTNQECMKVWKGFLICHDFCISICRPNICYNYSDI